MGHSIEYIWCIFSKQIRKNPFTYMSVSVCKMVCNLCKLKLLAAQHERGMVNEYIYIYKEQRVEINSRDLVPELVVIPLTLSFSHASHQSGHNSLTPIATNMALGRPQCCDLWLQVLNFH